MIELVERAAEATPLIEDDNGFDDEDFVLDVRVVEALQPVASLLQDTSDGCGSTCQGTACTSFTDDPA